MLLTFSYDAKIVVFKVFTMVQCFSFLSQINPFCDI